MLDQDGNGWIDKVWSFSELCSVNNVHYIDTLAIVFHSISFSTKDEFKLLETVMSSAAKERKQAQDNPDGGEEGGEGGPAKDEGKAFDDDDHGLQRAHKVGAHAHMTSL